MSVRRAIRNALVRVYGDEPGAADAALRRQEERIDGRREQRNRAKAQAKKLTPVDFDRAMNLRRNGGGGV